MQQTLDGGKQMYNVTNAWMVMLGDSLSANWPEVKAQIVGPVERLKLLG